MISSNRLKYLLIILPVIYGILFAYCYYQSKTFFSTYPDSIYIYLINGANIAVGNFAIGHYDNPGTTVHLLAGLLIYVTHLFAGTGSIMEDVLSCPEFYLRICVSIVAAMLLLSTYFSGKLILSKTQSISLALFFQLIPISSYFAIHYLLLVRIVPEALIMIAVTYYAAFLFVLCLERNKFNPPTRNKDNHVMFFSFITAFLIITKATCLPFIIIPLFFIRGKMPKTIYLISTFVFSLLLIFPIWPQLPDMFGWFKGLATHSGPYGQGKEELFNLSDFLRNVVLLLKHEIFFSISYVLILISLVAGLIKKKWDDNFYKLALSLWLVITGQLIFAAKHFGYHYIIASQSLAIPALIASFIFLTKWRPASIWNYVALIVCFLWFSFRTAESTGVYIPGNPIYKSSLAAKKYSGLPRIITTGYQGSCFPESALRFGSCYGGNYFHSGNLFLRKLYPDSYFYDMHLGVNYVKWWDVTVAMAELFQKHSTILFYIISWDENSDRNTIKKMAAGCDSLIKDIQIIDSNDNTGERFYIITVDTSKANPHYKEKISIFCDFEKGLQEKKSFLSTDGIYEFSSLEQSSTEKSFSGTTAVAASDAQGHPFACNAYFFINPGDHFEISVKYYADDRPGVIVLSGSDKNIFFQSSESIFNEYDNGWKKVKLNTTIPPDYPEEKVKFNLYYYGKGICYFDDLEITILKK